MQRNQKEISAKGIIMLFLLVITAITMQEGLVSDPRWYKILLIMAPIFLVLLIIPSKRKV